MEQSDMEAGMANIVDMTQEAASAGNAGHAGNDLLTTLGLATPLVEQLAEALVFSDREGLIRVWNPAAERLFAIPRDAALGRSLDLIIPERLRAPHWQGYHRALARGRVESRASRVTRALNGQGGALYVDMSFAVLVDAAGQAVGALAVARDATARYQDEKALRARLAALEAADGGGAGA